jgi:hypothetical protein
MERLPDSQADINIDEVEMVQRFVSPTTARVAGNVATIGFLAVMVLQLLLVLGILPITMAWGGTQTVLTPGLRLAGIAAVVILGIFAYIIRRRAGLTARGRTSGLIRFLAWVITGYMALNTLGNFASSSTGETLLFGPISVVLALSCLVVAASRGDA